MGATALPCAAPSCSSNMAPNRSRLPKTRFSDQAVFLAPGKHEIGKLAHLRPDMSQGRCFMAPHKKIVVAQRVLRVNRHHATQAISLLVERIEILMTQGPRQ